MEGVIAGNEPTSALQQWEIITGFALPLVTAFIIQSHWSQRVQALVAFGVSIVVTVAQLYLRGQLDNWTDPATSTLTVLALSVAFYKGFWRPTGVAPAIENATSARA